MEPLPWVLDMLQYYETILPLVESLWSSLQDEVYFMGGEAAGGLWRHQQWTPSWPPSFLLTRIGNLIKTARNGVLYMKNNTYITTLLDFWTRFAFAVERSKKTLYFRPKMAWPPATYDVTSCNHRNWPILNLSENMREGWTNSYWKCQVLMFYPLGKTREGGSEVVRLRVKKSWDSRHGRVTAIVSLDHLGESKSNCWSLHHMRYRLDESKSFKKS